MQWSLKSFDDLTNRELYDILKLRIDVFVVEQHCPYSDPDGKDTHPEAQHLFVQNADMIVACARLLPPGCSYPDMSSLGRVVTAPCVRGSGLGHKLLSKTMQSIDTLWPDVPCHISAQSHLQPYYAKHGFVSIGDQYLEDGIPHIGMRRSRR